MTAAITTFNSYQQIHKLREILKGQGVLTHARRKSCDRNSQVQDKANFF
ncbi:hypothetical protein [Kamptonema formosum]|nr:hypothetical protein [Oscillatoria sp. PCC 10802]